VPSPAMRTPVGGGPAMHLLVRSLVPCIEPDVRIGREAREETVTLSRITEGESSTGAGEGGRYGDDHGENVPLQKDLPTDFAG
jgi:hypothetical protein